MVRLDEATHSVAKIPVNPPAVSATGTVFDA
jgi:hypothetical protein